MSTTPKSSGPFVVVTGASQGIGAAIAQAFAESFPGIRLGLVARNATKLGAVAEQCRRSGAEVETVAVDLTDNAAVERMAATLHGRFGAVDVLINNAGSWKGGAAHEMSVVDFVQVLQDNLVSMFAVTRAFLAKMLERGSGDIFLMSSTSGLEGLANNSAYCAAKHGVTGFAKALRAEVASRGIRVSCVYPGPTATPTWDGSGVDASRLMSAADIADVFVDAYKLSRRTMMEDIVLRPLASL